MSRRAQQAIKQVVEKLKPYKPEKIILFGSHVWGKPDAGSDLDVLIIKRSQKRRIDRMREVGNLLYPGLMPVDALVYTPEEVEKRVKMGNTFVAYIVQHGKVLYDKSASKRGH